ncbi:hypothetical protein BDZ97DRAFT_1151633 [Flammula alnicola]|nr:hypothetical protein BDZ97DRAFT_1151633 [Flammula alnicola]
MLNTNHRLYRTKMIQSSFSDSVMPKLRSSPSPKFIYYDKRSPRLDQLPYTYMLLCHSGLSFALWMSPGSQSLVYHVNSK